jgi:hypothetical protein
MDYSMEEQSLRLLKAFKNIDDPETREMVITVAKFAEARARGKTQAVDGRPAQGPECLTPFSR